MKFVVYLILINLKDAEIAKVKASTRNEVSNILQGAKTLDTAMHGLRESINDKSEIKNNSKYINEDQPEKQAYDNAVNNAQQVIDETTATINPETVNNLTNAVTQAKSNLHGDTKLQQDKDTAKRTIAQLQNLNDAQKGLEDTMIDGESTRTQVQHDLAEAQALNGLMGTLKESIKDNSTITGDGNYINADPVKNKHMIMRLKSSKIINGTNQPTINKDDVSNATQSVKLQKML